MNHHIAPVIPVINANILRYKDNIDSISDVSHVQSAYTIIYIIDYYEIYIHESYSSVNSKYPTDYCVCC